MLAEATLTPISNPEEDFLEQQSRENSSHNENFSEESIDQYSREDLSFNAASNRRPTIRERFENSISKNNSLFFLALLEDPNNSCNDYGFSFAELTGLYQNNYSQELLEYITDTLSRRGTSVLKLELDANRKEHQDFGIFQNVNLIKELFSSPERFLRIYRGNRKNGLYLRRLTEKLNIATIEIIIETYPKSTLTSLFEIISSNPDIRIRIKNNILNLIITRIFATGFSQLRIAQHMEIFEWTARFGRNPYKSIVNYIISYYFSGESISCIHNIDLRALENYQQYLTERFPITTLQNLQSYNSEDASILLFTIQELDQIYFAARAQENLKITTESIRLYQKIVDDLQQTLVITDELILAKNKAIYRLVQCYLFKARIAEDPQRYINKAREYFKLINPVINPDELERAPIQLSREDLLLLFIECNDNEIWQVLGNSCFLIARFIENTSTQELIKITKQNQTAALCLLNINVFKTRLVREEIISIINHYNDIDHFLLFAQRTYDIFESEELLNFINTLNNSEMDNTTKLNHYEAICRVMINNESVNQRSEVLIRRIGFANILEIIGRLFNKSEFVNELPSRLYCYFPR